MYILSILFFICLIVLINAIFAIKTLNITFLTLVLTVLSSVLLVIIIDVVVASIVRWLGPKNWFDVSRQIFVASKKDCSFYEKIGIKRWKDNVLELGFFTGFRKNKILKPTDNAYVERFIVEANYGVAVHFVSCFAGFLIILFYPKYWLSIGLPVAIVNAFYNNLSFFILRYNLRRLHVLYKYNQRKDTSI